MSNLKLKHPEQKIVDATIRLLRRIGYRNIITELQFCERVLDIYAYKKSCSLAIEAKVKSPTKVFEQASRHKYIADYSLVSILKNKTNKTAIELSKKLGIGIIFVRKDSKERYYAKIFTKGIRSDKTNEYLVKYILEKAGEAK